MDIPGHGTLFIALDEQGQFTRGMRWRDGCVRANNRVALWILESVRVRGPDEETGSDWEEGRLVVGQLKDETE
jgi:hypothetical protein